MAASIYPRSRRSTSGLAAAALAVSWCATPDAAAQTTPANQARAEALFEDGKTLLAAGKLEEACARLAGSQAIAPAPGTLRFLAECYEKAGKSASAWATYQEAERAYRAASKTERIEEMRVSADRVKATISNLVITVPPDAASEGFEVRIDGQLLPRGAWGLPSPIDPGKHRVDATAPGKRAWSTEATVTGPRGVVTVSIVPLTPDAPGPAVGPAAAAAATPLKAPEPVASPAPAPSEEPRAADVGIRKGVGIGLAGLGVALGTVGVILAVGQANEMGELVNAKPFDRGAYDDANTKRKIGFGMLGGGIVLAGAGVAVALSKPSGLPSAGAPRRPTIGLTFAHGVWLNGSWLSPAAARDCVGRNAPNEVTSCARPCVVSVPTPPSRSSPPSSSDRWLPRARRILPSLGRRRAQRAARRVARDAEAPGDARAPRASLDRAPEGLSPVQRAKAAAQARAATRRAGEVRERQAPMVAVRERRAPMTAARVERAARGAAGPLDRAASRGATRGDKPARGATTSADKAVRPARRQVALAVQGQEAAAQRADRRDRQEQLADRPDRRGRAEQPGRAAGAAARGERRAPLGVRARAGRAATARRSTCRRTSRTAALVDTAVEVIRVIWAPAYRSRWPRIRTVGAPWP